MRFDPPLVRGRLLCRYKRFLVDVELEGGRVVTAHCTNTGSLLGCLRKGAHVMLAPAGNRGRKLRWTWKMVRVNGAWVGVDTSLAVPLVLEALGRGYLPELAGYDRILPEVPYGREGRSRIDLLLSRGGEAMPRSGRRTLFHGDERVYVEVKNTTLALDGSGARLAAFPDAVTERGQKHLHELVEMRRQGHRAAMVYCAQRSDCTGFVPAAEIDPAYATALERAVRHGVEVYALSMATGPRAIRPLRRLPIELTPPGRSS
ncbi:MAG: DNA/RNA nuclease SfsA [Myxococcota bacterium]